MSDEGVAAERREAEFKVEANSEEALIVLLLAWFKSQMIKCELAYQQGDKQALMAALQICFGVWLPAERPPPEWIWREINTAILANPKSWDDVFGKPVRSNWERATRWFRELQHYGFVVMTSAGYLGVDGQGRAPSWRLTEIGYMKDAPTRDFMRWVDGNFFVDEKQNSDGEITLRVRGKIPSPVTVTPPSPNGTSEGESTSIEADEVRGNPPSNLVYHSVEPKGAARRQPHQLSRAELEASYARRRVQ